jgi:hypothetical protein
MEVGKIQLQNTKTQHKEFIHRSWELESQISDVIQDLCQETLKNPQPKKRESAVLTEISRQMSRLNDVVKSLQSRIKTKDEGVHTLKVSSLLCDYPYSIPTQFHFQKNQVKLVDQNHADLAEKLQPEIEKLEQELLELQNEHNLFAAERERALQQSSLLEQQGYNLSPSPLSFEEIRKAPQKDMNNDASVNSIREKETQMEALLSEKERAVKAVQTLEYQQSELEKEVLIITHYPFLNQYDCIFRSNKWMRSAQR